MWRVNGWERKTAGLSQEEAEALTQMRAMVAWAESMAMQGDSHSAGGWSWQGLPIDCTQKVREGVQYSSESFPAALRLPGLCFLSTEPSGSRLLLPSCPPPAPMPSTPPPPISPRSSVASSSEVIHPKLLWLRAFVLFSKNMCIFIREIHDLPIHLERVPAHREEGHFWSLPAGLKCSHFTSGWDSTSSQTLRCSPIPSCPIQ